jgi:hypothetical protein
MKHDPRSSDPALRQQTWVHVNHESRHLQLAPGERMLHASAVRSPPGSAVRAAVADGTVEVGSEGGHIRRGSGRLQTHPRPR